MSTKLFVTAAVAALLGFGCSSKDVTEAPEKSSPPADGPSAKTDADGNGSPGASSYVPPASSDTNYKFKFVANGAAPVVGNATLYIRAASVNDGHETPAFANFLISTATDAETSIVSIDFPVELSVLGQVQSWSAPTTAPGIGLSPTGAAAASFRLGALTAGAPLIGGTLSLARGNGTLTGSLATGTAAGAISFDGRYEVVCFAPATQQLTAPPGELAPPPGAEGALAHDPEMATPFCQSFAFLRGN